MNTLRRMFLNHARPALVLFLLLSVLTGVAYPAAVTLVAKGIFPHQASGSIIERDGKAVGSALIGQPFQDPKYFWPRPSTTAVPYDAAASGGSNLGPTNPALLELVDTRAAELRSSHSGNPGEIPHDLVTASASGLDPHISPEAAFYQANRVAEARGVSVETIRALIARHIEGRTLGILGEPRVNVLELNLALDALSENRP